MMNLVKHLSVIVWGLCIIVPNLQAGLSDEEKEKYLDFDYASQMEIKVQVAPLSKVSAIFEAFELDSFPEVLSFSKRELLGYQETGDFPYIFIRIRNVGDRRVYRYDSQFAVLEDPDQIEQIEEVVKYHDPSYGPKWIIKSVLGLYKIHYEKEPRDPMVSIDSPPRLFDLTMTSNIEDLPQHLMLPLRQRIDPLDANLDEAPFVDVVWYKLYVK